MKYDYLIVGAGLCGATFAHKANEAGKRVLVIDKRHHIGGNIYTEDVEGIQVHKYGAHIFHTNDRRVWEYVNRFAEFNRYTNSPMANYRGDVPGATAVNCGNYLLHDLPMAKFEAKAFLKQEWKFDYPKASRVKTGGRTFFDA